MGDTFYYGHEDSRDVTVRLVSRSIDGTMLAFTSSDPLAVLHLHSDRLRMPRKFFDTCLSEWRAKSEARSPVVLSIEVRTYIKYYKDCFSRLYSRAEESPCVKNGIELLKVASQVHMQDIIHTSVFYLSSSDHCHQYPGHLTTSKSVVKCTATHLMAEIKVNLQNNVFLLDDARAYPLMDLLFLYSYEPSYMPTTCCRA